MPGTSRSASASATASSGSTPKRLSPVSTLTWTLARCAGSAAAASDSACRIVQRADRHAQVGRDQPRASAGDDAAEDEHGRVDAGAAQLLALVEADDAEAPGAGPMRGCATGDGAVAVSVAFDDGEQLRVAAGRDRARTLAIASRSISAQTRSPSRRAISRAEGFVGMAASRCSGAV